MKRYQKSSVLLWFLVISILTVGGYFTFIYYTQNHIGVVTYTINIQELGISFKVGENLKDIQYVIEDFGGEHNKIALLTSKTLIDADVKNGGKLCAESGLGVITQRTKVDGVYVPNGEYQGPHDRCSAVPAVDELQSQLIDELRIALKEAHVINENE